MTLNKTLVIKLNIINYYYYNCCNNYRKYLKSTYYVPDIVQVLKTPKRKLHIYQEFNKEAISIISYEGCRNSNIALLVKT